MKTEASNVNGFQLGAWLGKVGALTQFIAVRRKDVSQPVWVWNKIIVFSVVSVVTILLVIMFVDENYLNYLNAREHKVSAFVNNMTKFADSAWIITVTGICILTMQFVSGDKFRGKLHAVWHRMFFSVWFIFYSVVGSGILAVILKFIISRARPRYVVGNDPLHFEPFSLGYNLESFPSGHATTMGAMIVALCLIFTGYRWLIIPVGLFIASTRFILGAHFPSDVLAGLFLGGMFTWIYARSMAKHRLMFKFDQDGSISLRKEGKGYLRHIPGMIVQGFGGAKATVNKKIT